MFRRVKELSYQDSISRMFPGCTAKDITFQVTEDCNLRCTYCYQICKSAAVLSLDTAKAFIDCLYEANKDESEKHNIAAVLNFVGGEPFLQVQLIDQIMEYWMEKGVELRHPWARNFMISIATNGTLVFDPLVRAFIRKWKNKLSVSVSLDGNKDLHDACRVYANGKGSYDDALEAVQFVRSVLGDIATKMTFAPENIHFMYDALVNLMNLDYNVIHANVVFEEGWTIEHARTEYQQLKLTAAYMIGSDKEETLISIFNDSFFQPMPEDDTQNWCGGDGRMIAVNHTGKIYPCLRYMESSLGNKVAPITCGDTENGVDLSLLAGMRQITRQSQSEQRCLDCPVASGCSWCTAFNYQTFGTINKRATYICEMHKAESLANVYYWNKVYRKHGMSQRFKLNLPWEDAKQLISHGEYMMLQRLAKEE